MASFRSPGVAWQLKAKPRFAFQHLNWSSMAHHGIWSWNKHLPEWARWQKAIGGIYYTKRWRAETPQPGLEFENYKPWLESSIFKCISWLKNNRKNFCWMDLCIFHEIYKLLFELYHVLSPLCSSSHSQSSSWKKSTSPAIEWRSLLRQFDVVLAAWLPSPVVFSSVVIVQGTAWLKWSHLVSDGGSAAVLSKWSRCVFLALVSQLPCTHAGTPNIQLVFFFDQRVSFVFFFFFF